MAEFLARSVLFTIQSYNVFTDPDEHDLKISTGVLPRVPFKNPSKTQFVCVQALSQFRLSPIPVSRRYCLIDWTTVNIQ